MPSLVTPTEVKALVQTSLSDSQLQTVIDREEAWLALRIGQLSGARTQTFYPRRYNEPLYLKRYTSSVTVTNNGEAVTAGEAYGNYRLLGEGSIVALVGTQWLSSTTGIGYGPVTVAYTPSDSDAVKAAIIDLIRLRVTDSGYVSESIGQYSYQTLQAPGARDLTRRAIVRGLLPRHQFRSERIPVALER